MGQNNAKLTDPTMLIQAGIDPKTGLPIKCDCGSESKDHKRDIKKILRIIDEQDAINRFTWYNLPKGLDGQLIERILYYRGQAMLFYLQGVFYFLPYSLNGTIDVYGRFKQVTPLPFNGTANDGDAEKPWIQGLTFNPVYDVQIPEDFAEKSQSEILDFIENSCVILKDYSEQYSQTNIARQILNDPVLDLMSECYPFLRTALIGGTGVRGLKVTDDSEVGDVQRANNQLVSAALNARIFTPIKGTINFQELTNGSPLKAEEFLVAMQSLDSFRLSTYGLGEGGIFQKKAHMLEAEQETNTGNTGLVLRDSLQRRQTFCNIVNSIYGLNMWCEVSETVIGLDTTGDGVIGDDEAGQKEMISEEVSEDVE